MYRQLLIGVASASALVATASAPALASCPPTQISVGHVDAIDVAYENGAFELTVHDESVEPDVERDPASVVLVAKKESAIAVPDDPAYAFLGSPGTKVWVLPEVQDENLLWPGLSAEEIGPGVFVGDQITVRLSKIKGPDGLSLFTTGPGGEPNVLADSEDAKADDIVLPAGAHVHENWAFEKPGTYTITYDATGKLASTRKQVTSKKATITFEVKR